MQEQVQLHPLALGVPKTKESPFVRELKDKRLSIVGVLLEPGSDPAQADIRVLPRGPKRPRVFCPFCGRLGKYSHTDDYHHFSHLNDQDLCTTHDLETALHLRAKQLLLDQFSLARRRGDSLTATVDCARCEKPFRKGVCRPGSWDEEHPERSLVNWLRPDIALLRDREPVFLVEICVTHRVEPDKLALLQASGLAGVEIAASELFNDDGSEKWNYRMGLPASISAWGLERPPRGYNICRKCREIPEDLAIAARLAGGFAQADPDAWVSILAAAGLTGPWQARLRQHPRETLLDLTSAPESLRDEANLPAQEMSPAGLQSKLFEGLKLQFGAPALSFWASFAELGSALFEPVAQQIFEVSADISGNTERLSDDEDAIHQALKVAELAHQAVASEDLRHRALAWVGYALLSYSSRFGNTNMMESRLLTRLKELVPGTDLARLQQWIDESLANNGPVVRLSGQTPSRVALRDLATREREIVFELRAIQNRDRGALRILKSLHHRDLNSEQLRAIKHVADRPITLIHGAAGTGKSHVIKGILLAFPELHWLLLAPTGKAAERLRKPSVGRDNCDPPMTFAKFMVEQDEFGPLTQPRATGVILDEVGFAAVEIFAKLLQALNQLDVQRLVLVGDPEQLPSIGPGNVLGDLIRWARTHEQGIAEVELTQVMRSSSELSRAAGAVRSGCFPPLGGPLVLTPPEDDLDQQVVDAVRHLRNGGSENVQVIGQTRRLVERLNVALQNSLNPNGRPLSGAPYLRIRDRVICTENFYGRDTVLLNGQQAEICAETESEILLDTDNTRIRLPLGEVHRLALGYALTIHKAQGSEWDSVIIVLPGSVRQMRYIRRPLIYTALTRSKHHVRIIAHRDTLNEAIKRPYFRVTSLLHFLNKHRR